MELVAKKIVEHAISGKLGFDFKKKANPVHYFFLTEPKWRYNLDNFESERPHLVLYDANQKPVFTLQYEENGGHTLIRSIQREAVFRRTPRDPSSDIDAKKAADRLRKRIGMHPAEFLLSEFLDRHREELAKKPVYLLANAARLHPEIYGPIRDRFFSSKAVKVRHFDSVQRESWDLDMYPLSMDKERVRAIISGAPPRRKTQ